MLSFLPAKINATEGNGQYIYKGLLFVYVLISLFLFIRLLVQVISIKRIIRNSDKIEEKA